MSGDGDGLRPWPRDPRRPAHPKGPAIAVLVAVTLLIVVLAAISTF